METGLSADDLAKALVPIYGAPNWPVPGAVGPSGGVWKLFDWERKLLVGPLPKAPCCATAAV